MQPASFCVRPRHNCFHERLTLLSCFVHCDAFSGVKHLNEKKIHLIISLIVRQGGEEPSIILFRFLLICESRKIPLRVLSWRGCILRMEESYMSEKELFIYENLNAFSSSCQALFSRTENPYVSTTSC